MTTFLPPLETPYLQVGSDNGKTTLDFKLHLEPRQQNVLTADTEPQQNTRYSGISASVLDYLLANQELIPNEWKGKRIFFFGTIYRAMMNGEQCVRYLSWSDYGGFWCWYQQSFNANWRESYHVLLEASPSSLEERVSALEAIVKKHNLTP